MLAIRETDRVAQLVADFAIMTMDPTGMDAMTLAWYEGSRRAVTERAAAAETEREVQRGVAAEFAVAEIAAIAQLRVLETERRASEF